MAHTAYGGFDGHDAAALFGGHATSPETAAPEDLLLPIDRRTTGCGYPVLRGVLRLKEDDQERDVVLYQLDATTITQALDDLTFPASVEVVSDDPSGLVKLSGNNDYAVELHSSPYAMQVLVDAAVGAKPGDPIPLAPGVMAAGGGGGNLSWAVLGIVAASSAVTALAGGAVSPAVVFGSFLVLLAGVALVMGSVRTT